MGRARSYVAKYFALRPRVLRGDIPAWVLNATVPKRRIAQILASVPWEGNRKAVLAVYAEAKRRGMTVDHVIPLRHPYVCGLTVPGNLRIVPHAVNTSKCNKWHPDQLDAWETEPEPHQLQLAV